MFAVTEPGHRPQLRRMANEAIPAPTSRREPCMFKTSCASRHSEDNMTLQSAHARGLQRVDFGNPKCVCAGAPQLLRGTNSLVRTCDSCVPKPQRMRLAGTRGATSLRWESPLACTHAAGRVEQWGERGRRADAEAPEPNSYDIIPALFCSVATKEGSFVSA